MMKSPIRLTLGAALLALAGCSGPLLGVNVFVVGERTSLENQVLGAYQTLNADFEAYASVRGVDETGQVRPAPPTTDSKAAALAAMRNRAYNRDDVQDFLAQGWVGEGRDAMLAVFDEPLATLPQARRDFVRAVVDEENADRRAILERLLTTTPGLTPDERPRVRAILAQMNREAAPAGARLQEEGGSWSAK